MLTFNWDETVWNEIESREDVKTMPVYPDEGYFKQIGKTIVVKFANLEEKES